MTQVYVTKMKIVDDEDTDVPRPGYLVPRVW